MDQTARRLQATSTNKMEMSPFNGGDGQDIQRVTPYRHPLVHAPLCICLEDLR